MPAKPGQKLICGYIDEALADRFNAWARQTDGGASAALRRLVAEAVGEKPPAPRGVGWGNATRQVREEDSAHALVDERLSASNCLQCRKLRRRVLPVLADVSVVVLHADTLRPTCGTCKPLISQGRQHVSQPTICETLNKQPAWGLQVRGLCIVKLRCLINWVQLQVRYEPESCHLCDRNRP